MKSSLRLLPFYLISVFPPPPPPGFNRNGLNHGKIVTHYPVLRSFYSTLMNLPHSFSSSQLFTMVSQCQQSLIIFCLLLQLSHSSRQRYSSRPYMIVPLQKDP